MIVRLVDAQYEHGVLRPSEQLPLRAGEHVTLIVVRRPDAARWNMAKLSRHHKEDIALAEDGLGDWMDALDAEDGQ